MNINVLPTLMRSILALGAGFGSAVATAHGRGPFSEATLRAHPGSVLNLTEGRRVRLVGNRWWPHHGAKERARHTNSPDGPMHRSPVVVRSNDWKRAEAEVLANLRAEPAKPARKPRAKKAA